MQQIIDIIKNAGQIQIDYKDKDLNVQFKSASQFDAVTDADIASSNYIIQNIRNLFPDDFICCEEDIDENIDWTKRVWIIDPLDGTYSYIRKEDTFSIIVGCCENGIFTHGIVYFPSRNELFYSAKGEGVYFERNGNLQQIVLSPKSSLEECSLIYKKPSLEIDRLKFLYENLDIPKDFDFTPIGNAILKIVKGQGDILFLKKAGKRDIGGLECILNELGYAITDSFGNLLDYSQQDNKFVNGVVVVPQVLVEELVGIM